MEIAEAGEGHECICICDRCKNGRETFLLPGDVKKIQDDAIAEGLRRTADLIRATSSHSQQWIAAKMESEAEQLEASAAQPNDPSSATRLGDNHKTP